MADNNDDLIPKSPTVTGFSRRLKVVMILGALGLFALLLLFIRLYAPSSQPQHDAAGAQASLSASAMQDSATLIQSMKDNERHGAVSSVTSASTAAAGTATAGGHNTTTTTFGLSAEEYKAAANADVSVYAHAPSADQDSARPSSAGVMASNPGVKAPNQPDPYDAQNKQDEKTAFLRDTGRQNADRLPEHLQQAASPYELMAGTIIPATLETAINSDLPGPIIAVVRRDVFDTVSGNYLLIPQGTKLTGQYDASIAYGQSRVLFVWSRLQFPDGSSFDLEGMPGADLMGAAGMSDQVNNHYWRIFGSAAMFSLFGAAGQLSQPQQAGGNQTLTNQQIIFGAVGQQMSQTAAQMVAKNMNIQPTITIRPGAKFNVLVTRDMVFPRPYHFVNGAG